MSKLDTENSLIEPNGSFSENVSTTFVHDCSLAIFKFMKLKVHDSRFISFGIFEVGFISGFRFDIIFMN